MLLDKKILLLLVGHQV